MTGAHSETEGPGFQVPAVAVKPGPGAIGGAANEAGGEFRAGLAAYVAAHVLRGQPFADLALLPEAAIPRSFTLEADAAVDDVEVKLSGGVALIQAKRRLGMNSVKAAAGQWISLAEDGAPDPDRQRLVIAGAEASREVRYLKRALERNRRESGGGLTKSESKALEKLRGYLKELSVDVREQVLRCGVIWIADLDEDDGLLARLGQTLLEPGVVAVGDGVRAWKALRHHAHDLARKRFGATLEDLVALLKGEGLSLTEDGRGYDAARLRDRQVKLDAYCRRVRERGESLDLGVLGANLPPLALSEIDASVSVYAVPVDADEEEGHNGGLAWALRRRGQALLLGLPGSGKSVALRAAAAHYAARADWPLPLVVSLQRVSRRLDSKGFGAALLEVAFENEPIEDQPALQEAAIALLRRGEAALFLDALDESGAGRHRIVEGLREELAQSDPAVEVLLSTRDVAYAQAHILKFSDLRLNEPDRPETTVRTILRATAEQRRLRGEEAKDWVEARREWVRARLETDRELRETPLMVVLLTLAAAEHEDENALPVGRAAILQRVVSDVVERWEAHHRIGGEEAALGSLDGGDAKHAAGESFAVIGDCVYREGSPTAQRALDPIGAMLHERFGLAPGAAEVAAGDVMALWDEAGVFVEEGDGGQIRTRIQLFAELAHALVVCEGSEDSQREWARGEAEAGEESQPLLLAAGLSEAVSSTLTEWVIESPDDSRRLELCRKAIDQGARLGAGEAEALIDRLLEVEDIDEARRWDRARLLMRLAVAPEKQAQALEMFNGLGVSQRLVARVIATESWPRNDEDVEADLRNLLEADPELFKNVKGRMGMLTPDPHYQQAILIASRRLIVPDDAELARSVAGRMRRAVSMRTGDQLRRLLIEKGFAGVVADAERKDTEQRGTGGDFARMLQESDDADRKLVGIVAGFAEPAQLDRISRRRLDHLVSLIKTSRFAEAAAGHATNGVLRDSESLSVALRTAVERGGLELSAMAAEGKEWLETKDAEADVDPFGPIFMLNDGGKELQLGPWDRVSDPIETAKALAVAVSSPYPWIGHFATKCLVGVDPIAAREEALRTLEELLAKTSAAPQRMVALAIGLVSPEEMLLDFAGDERPMVRRAAAWLAKGASQDAPVVLRALLGDPDGGVRKEAAEAVEAIDLAEKLSGEIKAAAEDADGWQCIWCGADNGPESGRCAGCELSGSLLGIPPAEPIKLGALEE